MKGLQLATDRWLPSWLLPAVCLALFGLMLLHPRAFVAALVVLVLLLAVGLAVQQRGLRLAPASLGALALGGLATATTVLLWPGLGLERLGQPWLLLAFLVAAVEVQRRLRLTVRWWMPAAALVAALLVWDLLAFLSIWGPIRGSGVNYAKLSVFADAHAKTLFFSTPAVWLLVGLWYRATGKRRVLWLLALPLVAAVASPSQSISLGFALGLAAAVLAVRPWLAVLATVAVILLPAAAVLAAPDLTGLGVPIPESWAWRVELWSEGLRLALERPLTGWGLQSFRELNDTLMQLERPNHSHAIGVELLLDFGVWGLAAMAGLGLAIRAALLGWGSGLGARLLVLPPLIAWLTVTSVSLGLWTDTVFGGTMFLLALAGARVRPRQLAAATPARLPFDAAAQ